MKTAISLPDETFRQATEAAARLGMSRSELFARAMREYLARLADESLTARIDAVVAHGPDDDTNRIAANHGRRTIAAATASDDW